jgi:hypothetical protein
MYSPQVMHLARSTIKVHGHLRGGALCRGGRSCNFLGRPRQAFRSRHNSAGQQGGHKSTVSKALTQHQAAMRRCGVGPCVAEGTEIGLALGDGRHRVQQIAGGACEAVQPRHRQHVARFRRGNRPAKLGSVGLGIQSKPPKPRLNPPQIQRPRILPGQPNHRLPHRPRRMPEREKPRPPPGFSLIRIDR